MEGKTLEEAVRLTLNEYHKNWRFYKLRIGSGQRLRCEFALGPNFGDSLP